MSITNPHKIVISRTDSIGDVVLTLPLAGILKEHFPSAQIVFLGNTYTRPIIQCCPHVDEIWEWAELEKKGDDELIEWLASQEVDTFIHVFPRKELAKKVKKARIPNRIGTSHRLYHLSTCNHRPNFSRKRSDLHESQLNCKLLQPLGISKFYSLAELTEYAGFKNPNVLPEKFSSLFPIGKKKIILHPKSQGSAVEWPLEDFVKLMNELSADEHEIFVTGTEKEAEMFRKQLPQANYIHDMGGKMTLEELISFIEQADYLVAASTGPLHIAGMCGIHTIGLFSTIKPIHAGRWKPLGINTIVFEDKKNLKNPQPLAVDYRDIVQEIQRDP
ncbi:MAG: glycosyltransferase family 9 protein [Flavobacteriales bacterium]|nr:glycosyltransferase family 9 protein [Flavobacteriales bacterium]